MACSLYFPATLTQSDVAAGFLLAGRQYSVPRLRSHRVVARDSLDTGVADMRTNAPKGLFPPEPEHYKGPKLKVAIIGAGLAGMSTAVELLDQGHEVDIYESRKFVGGKVGSSVDRRGNHREMGLHVFFGCYNNLFRLRKKVGADKNLLVKDHTNIFINKGGELAEVDFRFPVGAPIHVINGFVTTNQLQPYDKVRSAVALALSPVVRALVDPDGAMKDIRNLDSDYIDSMEGATLSGRHTSAYVCDAGEELVTLRKNLAALESQELRNSSNVSDELRLV